MVAKAFRKFFCTVAVCMASLPAQAAVCVGGSLGSYVALGSAGCTVGALTFSDFVVDAFPGPTAKQIAPDTLSIDPIASGFAVSSNTGVATDAGNLTGLRLLFDVHAPALLGGTVGFGPNRSASGDGALTALLDAGASGNAIALVIDGFADTPQSFASGAVGAYVAFLELGIDGGTSGSASLGPQLASLTFAVGNIAPVPEPEIAMLTLAGLVVVFARRRLARRLSPFIPAQRGTTEKTP